MAQASSLTILMSEEKIHIKDLQHARDYCYWRAGGKFGPAYHTGNPQFRGPIAYKWVNDLGTYWVTFKRSWLYSYAKQFRRESGLGQSMNLRLIMQAMKDDPEAWLLLVMENGVGYGILAREWFNYSQKHETSRTPSTEDTIEVSIPANTLQRIGWVSPPLKKDKDRQSKLDEET